MRVAIATALICSLLLLSGCQNNIFKAGPSGPVAMSAVPAVRLNFRYEADVPAPSIEADKAAAAIDPGVQADFDANRNFELLERTLPSPDKKHILAIYRHIADVQLEYRLDMYAPDGKPVRKMTSDTMAVHFPDTIVWSPDSNSVAFVAMIRAMRADPEGTAAPTPANPNASAATPTPVGANANTPVDDADSTSPTPVPLPTMAAPNGILTFRTEQIYIAGADGSGVKPITETEGLIYFYYAWSPDSSMLVALALTSLEWKRLELIAASKGETMVPMGRLRVIEKNGRERRLDDNQTAVRPVWSPDSSKVATAFDNQIRLYDAAGTNPTQAAIPLRNQLLLSSQAYDRDQQRKMQDVNADPNVPANTQPAPEQPSTLPDEKLLVSYNPIVEIAWTADDLLYLQTAYVKRMRNEADSVRSFSRWHRLVLTAQAPAPAR